MAWLTRRRLGYEEHARALWKDQEQLAAPVFTEDLFAFEYDDSGAAMRTSVAAWGDLMRAVGLEPSAEVIGNTLVEHREARGGVKAAKSQESVIDNWEAVRAVLESSEDAELRALVRST